MILKLQIILPTTYTKLNVQQIKMISKYFFQLTSQQQNHKSLLCCAYDPGLGTSSILAGAVMAALLQTAGKTCDRQSLIHLVGPTLLHDNNVLSSKFLIL